MSQEFKRVLPNDPLFGDSSLKPDLRMMAESMAKDHEASAFTDQETLGNWIHHALEEIWVLSQRAEEKRIEALCRKRGWIK